MWDAFISYAREDLELTERLHLALVQSGKTVWRDLHDIAAGETFWNRIEDAISGSHYLLFVMTDRSLGSANCRKEIDLATQSNKRILPIDFRSVRTGSVWGEIAGIQWIYAEGRFDSAVLELVQTLNGIPQYRRLHTQWLERAREWSGTNRDKSNLLRGTELASAEQWLEQSVTLQPAPTDSQIEFIKASRTEEDSSRDRMLARRLSNQAEVLFSEGASMLEKSLLIAVESVRRQPMMGAHRVLTQGLERLPTRLPPIALPKIFAVNADPPLLATVEPDQDIKITALSGTGGIRAIRAGIDKITALEFSRSTSLLLARYRDSFAKVINAVSEKEILTARSPGAILHIKFSHDEKQLLVLDQMGSLQIFDLRARATSLEMVREDWQAVTCTAFHGKWMAMQEADQDVVIYSLPDVEEVLRLAPGELERMEFSPDGSRFLTVPTKGGQPELWHMETGKRISSFEAHNWGVNGVAFRPETGHLATASSDRTARLWDANGVNIQVLEHETEVFDVLWAKDGNSFSTRERNGTVQWWDTLGRGLGSTPADGVWRTVLGMYGTARTRMLITAAETTLERWVFGIASGPLALLNDKNPLLTSVALSNDGRYLAQLSDYHRLLVNDVRTGNEILAFESDQPDDVTLVSASPDPRYFLLHSPSTFLADIETQQVTRLRIQVAEEIAWSATGCLVAGEGAERFGEVWSMPDAKLLFTGDQIVWGLAFSPDEQTLARVGPNAPLRLTRISDGTTRAFLGHEGSTYSCTFSPDGSMVASSGEDGTARIWDLSSGREVRCLRHPPKTVVRQVRFSPDSRFVATCGDDKTVRVWSLTNGQETFRGLHREKVNVVRFDPSGHYLGSGAEDQTARVWDLASGEEIARFQHEEYVYDTQFSSDGNFLATLSAYGTRRVGRLWLWNPTELVRQLESRLTRSLSTDESLYYLGTS
jgi:WD40 repeat protein